MNQQIIIDSSKNYKRFQFIPGNRSINREHLRTLKRSIEKKNLLKYNPGIVNKDWGLIDGQHRFLIAQELGIPFYFIVANDVDFSDIVLLNNTNRRWKMDDYLETFIHQGLEDYKILKDFAQKYSISLSTALAVLSLDTRYSDLKAPLTDYKIGEFKVIDLKESVTFITSFQEISVYAEENTSKDRDFLRATYRMFYKFGILPKDFMDKMKQYPYPLFRRLNIKDYLRQFEDVYNFNRIKTVRFI